MHDKRAGHKTKNSHQCQERDVQAPSRPSCPRPSCTTETQSAPKDTKESCKRRTKHDPLSRTPAIIRGHYYSNQDSQEKEGKLGKHASLHIVRQSLIRPMWSHKLSPWVQMIPPGRSALCRFWKNPCQNRMTQITGQCLCSNMDSREVGTARHALENRTDAGPIGSDESTIITSYVSGTASCRVVRMPFIDHFVTWVPE